jgi:hypothetical protein
MAPKKQNRFASSKEALSTFDKQDSNIMMTVFKRNPLSKKLLVFSLSSVIVSIVALMFFLPNRHSDLKFIPQSKVPVQSDLKSASISMDSSWKTNEDTSLQKTNKLLLKSPTSKQNVVLSHETIQAARDSGTVMLTSTPWAKIYIDNKYIGETPFSKPLILAAGRHSVLFVHPSFDPIMQTITVLPFREGAVTGNFFNNVGYLNCLATPWAEIYINDQYKDTTPLEKPIMLSPGKYKVRFKNASFQDIVREVTVHSKDTASLVITFMGRQ